MDARMFKKGDRVRLDAMDDPFAKAPIGALGTVTGTCPPPINVVNVEWDCGFGLNPCLDVDRISRVEG